MIYCNYFLHSNLTLTVQEKIKSLNTFLQLPGYRYCSDIIGTLTEQHKKSSLYND